MSKVKTVPQKFEANGREFDTKAEAERYADLTEKREALESAQRKFQRVLAESAKTADGQPFEFGVWHDYWRVFVPFHSIPRLEKFDFIGWNWMVREDGETVEISEEPKDDRRRQWVPICELYASQQKANAALLVAMREWLEERRQEIDQFEAKNFPKAGK